MLPGSDPGFRCQCSGFSNEKDCPKLLKEINIIPKFKIRYGGLDVTMLPFKFEWTGAVSGMADRLTPET
jgi:hypothetical protein